MTNNIAFAIVLTSALYLLVLGIVAVLKPAIASRFLLGFVSSAPLHFLEMLIRILIGSALVIRSPHMANSTVFFALGYLLIGTSIVLLLIPWRWHQGFAQRAVPLALPYLKFIALCAFALGSGILYCALI